MGMKHLRLFIFLIGMHLIPINSSAQLAFELFRELPDSAVLNLNKDEREKIIQLSKDNKDWNDAVKDLNTKQTDYVFEKADTKNNYLKLIGNFEGQWQMKVWNLYKHKNFLVATYKETCCPVCSVEHLVFYYWNIDEKKFIETSSILTMPTIKMRAWIPKKLPVDCVFTEDDVLDLLLYDFDQKNNEIKVTWNSEPSTSCPAAFTFQLYLLPDNLKNETYFGIKEN